jgi:hypothetical protein
VRRHSLAYRNGWTREARVFREVIRSVVAIASPAAGSGIAQAAVVRLIARLPWLGLPTLENLLYRSTARDIAGAIP